MTPPAPAQVEFTPVFDWSPPRRRKISLFSFIAASVALHALCFYLFQIIYPPTVALLPPPARVNVITGDSEESRALLRWIESEDPALSSITQRPPNTASPGLPDSAHVPSYANWQPVLRDLSPTEADLRIPSAQPPGPVPLPSPAAPSSARVSQSTLRFGSEADGLRGPAIPPLHFTASRREPPQVAEFRVAIDAAGAVRHCLLQSSSGDSALDEQARRTVLLCRFGAVEVQSSESADSLLWTTATIEWGNDVAPPAEAPSATKPAP